MLTNYKLSWPLIDLTFVLLWLAVGVRLILAYDDIARQTERRHLIQLIQSEMAEITAYPPDLIEPPPLTLEQWHKVQTLLKLEQKLVKLK